MTNNLGNFYTAMPMTKNPHIGSTYCTRTDFQKYISRSNFRKGTFFNSQIARSVVNSCFHLLHSSQFFPEGSLQFIFLQYPKPLSKLIIGLDNFFTNIGFRIKITQLMNDFFNPFVLNHFLEFYRIGILIIIIVQC